MAGMDVDASTAPAAADAGAAADTCAGAAAAAAAVVVREVIDPVQLGTVCELFRRIWSEDSAAPPLTPPLLHALAYAGSYVALAQPSSGAGADIAGACVGFYGRTDHGWELHSHIAGVAAAARGRGVGFALKTHQRAWALRRGLDRISWTFDPLVRRNAHFNLCRLAARPRAYLDDFYGPMTDGINAGDDSDRLVVEWRLLDEPVARACAGAPAEPDIDAMRARGAAVGLSVDAGGGPVVGTVDSRTVLVAVPADIERLRVVDRPSATAWRRGVRQVLAGLLDEGAVVTGFARDGWYVVQRAAR